MPPAFYRSDTLRQSIGVHAMRRDYRPLYRGIWVPKRSEPTLAVRSLAVASLYPGGTLVGPSAAAVRGARLDPGFLPEIGVGPAATRRAGVVFRRYEVPEEHVQILRGTRVASPALTVFDLARFHDRERAVLAIEKLIDASPATRRLWAGGVDSLFDGIPATWGSARARRTVARVDPLNESAWESILRLAMAEAGISGFVSQLTLPEHGARIDLAHPEAKVAVEFDGEYHRTKQQQAADAERRNRLQAAGWIVIVVTATMLMRKREQLLTTIRTALASRGF
ncbi:endonuclease domain-containing protein [Dietzia sp. 179-F 9C3 NHS]|uniref:endonuclease domain-containing protein n=1 Tax=Dietzia sp. 179-F 9C3 NHS TaxID=3374295 RepID=UPI0038795002